MTNTVNFLLESGVSLALLSLIYILFLRKETFFRLNRIFLLISVTFSIVLPFLKFRIYEPESIMLSEITVTPYRNLLEAVTIYGQDFSGAVEHTISSSRIVILVYLIGLLFFLGRLILKLVQIALLIKKNPVDQSGKIRFVSIDKNFSPFSFLNYIFINPDRKQEMGYEKMVTHEMEHIRQGHSFDVMLLEIMTVFQWFNPFLWILKRVIRENHEYLADRAVLNSGFSSAQYKKLLLTQAVGFQVEIANNFNSSLIKNRIKMISKIKSSKIANVKYGFGILALIAIVIAFACEQKEVDVSEKSEIQPDNTVLTLKHSILEDGTLKIEGTEEDIEAYKNTYSAESNFEIISESPGTLLMKKIKENTTKTLSRDEQVFYIVEEMPDFPGGDLALRKHIAANVEYPEEALKNEISGKVYVEFVVGKDGSVVNAQIVRGVAPSLDKEALRVVNELPKWTPGYQRGTPVNVKYTVPINFALQ